MTDKNDYFTLGHITKTVGMKGELAFFLDVDFPQKYKNLESVFVEINGDLLPFFISRIQIKKNTAMVFLEGIDNLERANELAKSTLFLPLKSLTPLKGKNFYFHEIIGFKVIDNTNGDIGTVDTILEFPQQNILQIKNGNKEILIPVRNEFIQKVDRENKIIEISAPNGLIDLYLDKPEG